MLRSKKDGSVVENLIESLSIPMFYKFSNVNKFITNRAFDNFFGSSRKKVLDYLNSLNINSENKFEIEVENDIGKKISAIAYISSMTEDSDDKLGLLVDITEQKKAKDVINVLKERYELATKGSNEGLWDWDVQKNELYTSLKFKEILADKADNMNNSLKSWVNIILKEDRSGFIKALEDHINGKNPKFNYEYRVNYDGVIRWYLARGKAVYEDGELKRVVGFLSDISKIKKAQLALKDSQEQFELFMENLPAGVYIRDLGEKIIFSNRYINNFFGKKTLIGSSLKELFHTKQYKDLVSLTEQIIEKNIVNSEILLKDRFDNEKYFYVNQFLLHRDNKKYIGTILTDITAQKLTEKKLNKLAHYDLLTNLPNRALFYDSLNNSLSKAKRKDKKVALMFIDLDNFKTINDTLGHDYGDILLKEVSKKLKDILRIEDVVSRLGGDEFTVILDPIEDNTFPSIVAQKIIDELSKPIRLKDEMGYIGSSIGIAIYPDDANDIDTLIKFADMAMYRAKESGKNAYRYFTIEMDEEAREKMELTNDLRNAVLNNQLKLYYQPIVDVNQNQIALFEALVRWEHPKYGLISPDNFISLAEEGGFMVKIGRWILKEACQQIKKIENRGYDIKIAVNISSKQLTQNHLEQTTKEVVKQSGINPSHLELEVTEGFLMENIKKVEQTLSNLKKIGIGIAIDDFGTGYSSLSRLKSLPISKLKIDKSFINDVVNNKDDRKITMVIISLAQGLGLDIVAEGVETKEQLEFLKKQGVSKIQGYYFSKPIASEKVDKFLDNIVK
jgi:diguanylate cyclase (GGDEF)-like protein/PAS domain S-box-containing protein